MGFLLLAVSAVLLTVGSEIFAEHAAGAGRRFGVTVLAIGLVLAGAEPEELVTAALASARHLPGIAAGDAIGANVTMLTVVLGLAAIFRPLRLNNRIRGYALLAAAAGVIAAAAISIGTVGRIWGVVLLAAYALAVGIVWRRERRPPAFGEAAELEEIEEHADAETPDPRAALLVIAGVALMTGGGWLAVSGAQLVATSLGLAESVVGLTFVALATTAELFALVWASYRRGLEELAVAGVLGSAVYNATATLGVAALINPFRITTISWQAWLAAALPIALVAIVATFKRVGRAGGSALVATYAGYLVLTIR